MTTHTQPVAVPVRFSPTRAVLWSLMLLGLAIAVIRFTSGIGAISNLSNAYPWGLWISLDLLCGVSLAAGAFTVCAAVYIFGQEQFRPLVRPAVLTGWLGYLMVIVALLVDLGRPERIWHMIIYWNPHSPLFEVGLCVMTYTIVLTIEFAPLFFEWIHWPRWVDALHKISLPFVVGGVFLSTLHQSSLGSLFLTMSDKLHPLWHSPILPIFFFVSAAAVGLAMTIFEATISAHAYGRPQETHILGRLAKAIPWLLGLYLMLKLAELYMAGDLHLLFDPGRPAILFWTELVGGVILPIILFSLPAIRRSQTGLFLTALLQILGLMLNRFDVGLINWVRPAGSSYTPHWMELALSIGVISAGVLAYDFVARHMALFSHDHGKEEHA